MQQAIEKLYGKGLIAMSSLIQEKIEDQSRELVGFAQRLVQTQSYSGNEKAIIELIKAEMESLGYDEVIVDAMGNVIGRIGDGDVQIMFDSHVDTVEVKSPSEWTVPPFSGEIVDGKLYGRGSVDMKSSIAASVYAGATVKNLGLLDGKTVFVSCTVFEEDCDGENLKHLFKELSLKPDYFVTCEPSGNKIVTGHKGKAQIAITSHGLSAHGSAPEKGVNAVYEMAEIIQRVEATNNRLSQMEGDRRTLVLSNIESTSVSLNAVPSSCEIYLDRRMVLDETEEMIKDEMDKIVEGKNATWAIGTIERTSYTGMPITYEPFHLAWKTNADHPLMTKANEAYSEVFKSAPLYDYWDFSTNAVTPVVMGIPCIGFGPGAYKLAHMIDEHCAVKQIIEASQFYAVLTATL